MLSGTGEASRHTGVTKSLVPLTSLTSEASHGTGVVRPSALRGVEAAVLLVAPGSATAAAALASSGTEAAEGESGPIFSVTALESLAAGLNICVAKNPTRCRETVPP